jgi:hypothetical protein
MKNYQVLVLEFGNTKANRTGLSEKSPFFKAESNSQFLNLLAFS